MASEAAVQTILGLLLRQQMRSEIPIEDRQLVLTVALPPRGAGGNWANKNADKERAVRTSTRLKAGRTTVSISETFIIYLRVY